MTLHSRYEGEVDNVIGQIQTVIFYLRLAWKATAGKVSSVEVCDD